MISQIRTADSSANGLPVRKMADRKANNAAISLGMTVLLYRRVKERLGQAAAGGFYRDFVSRVAALLLLAGIRFYQAVFAPVMPVGCKFYPSCSHYAAEAIARHGAARGVWLAAARLWRCRPFTKGGFDPVPDVAGETSEVFGNGLPNGMSSRARNEVGS